MSDLLLIIDLENSTKTNTLSVFKINSLKEEYASFADRW